MLSPLPALLPLLPLLLTAFLPAGVCVCPHLVPVGVPPPPNSAFLDRETFVWGLDREQGSFEWLVEDWGHGEGQGQKRGGSVLATSWTPGDPQYHHRGGEEGCRNQARERVECRPGKRGLEVKALLGLFAGGRENRPPLLSREGQGGSNVHPAVWFLHVVPSGNFSVPGPKLGQVLSPLPFRRGQSPQEVEGTLREGGAQSKWEIRGGWR